MENSKEQHRVCWSFGLLMLVVAVTATDDVRARQRLRGEPSWSLNATVIEACSDDDRYLVEGFREAVTE